MRISPGFILLFFCLSSHAIQKVDSLKYELSIHQGDDELKVDILNNLGFEYWIVNPVQSIIYGQQAIALAEILNDSSGVANANRVVGVAHWAKGSYDHGLEYLLDGLSIFKSLNDTLGIANCLMNIGLIYSDRADYDLASQYFFESLKLFESVGATERSATTYVKLATVFINEGKLNAALDFLNRAVNIHGPGKFFYGMSEILNRFGMLKMEMKQYDSANLYLGHSLEVSMKIDDLDGVTKNYADLAKVALLTNKYEEAERLLQEGLVYARKVGSHKWLKEIYHGLTQIARNKGNLEQAIFYYDQYTIEKDSIFNEQMLNNLTKLEAELATLEQKRQLDAKENEIFILEQASRLQNTQLIISVVFALVVILFSILVMRNRKLVAEKNKRRMMEEADKVRQELEFKNRELVSYTINFVQKNQLFEELTTSIKDAKKNSPDDLRKDLIVMERTVKKHLQIDKDWEDFKLRFENLHSGFFDKILGKESSLTGNDLKLCALVKMNFSIKEIADMMGISSESVKTSRYRLKKKLQLPAEMSLNDFLYSID